MGFSHALYGLSPELPWLDHSTVSSHANPLGSGTVVGLTRDRIFLGLAESGLYPGVAYYLTMFVTTPSSSEGKPESINVDREQVVCARRPWF